MAPGRIAVSTVFICIAVLLCSACGLPLGPAPRVRPTIFGGDFALYAPHHALIANGTLSPATDPNQLRASLTLNLPGCLDGTMLDLTGALKPTLTLRSTAAGTQLTLRSTTAAIYQPYAVRVLPFTGRLTLTHSCADQDIPIQAELLPSP